MAPWVQKKDKAGGSPPGPVKVLRVSPYLSEQAILIVGSKRGKNELVGLLVNDLCRENGLLSRDVFLAKVLDRERGISTTLDTGLSLPHARMDGLDKIIAAMAIVPGGMRDPQQADLIIRAMFLFFSPNKQEFFPLHLQLLRSVSLLFQPSFIDQVARAAGPAEAFKLIRDQEGR